MGVLSEERRVLNVFFFYSQQLASLQSGDDAKESDSEQLSLSDRSTSAITQLSCQEVISKYYKSLLVFCW